MPRYRRWSGANSALALGVSGGGSGRRLPKGAARSRPGTTARGHQYKKQEGRRVSPCGLRRLRAVTNSVRALWAQATLKP